jgi:type III secretion protein L
MSALIKAAGAAETSDPIRAFAPPLPQSVPQLPAREALLEQRIVELQESLAAEGERHRKDLERARKESARVALEQRSDAEERAIQTLTEASAAANAAWNKRLHSWEATAIAIARAVLEKIFADADERSALVESCIKHKMRLLEKGSVARLRVSGTDFPDLTPLGADLTDVIEVVSDAALGTGECIVDLKLGQIDLGLDAQWARVAQLLEALERESLQC